MSILLLKFRESQAHKDQTANVFNDINDIVGSDSNIVNPINLKFEIHRKISIIKMPNDLVDASNNNPGNNIIVLKFILISIFKLILRGKCQ